MSERDRAIIARAARRKADAARRAPEPPDLWCVLMDTTAPWPEVVFVGTREAALEYERDVTDYETSVQRVHSDWPSHAP